MKKHHQLQRIKEFPQFRCDMEYPIEENFFQSLAVDITYRCNMDCKFCWNPVRMIPDMTTEFFEEACRRLPGSVSWKFLGGEPTLHKELFEFIRIAHKYGHTSYISSNGIKYTDPKFMNGLRQLKEEGINFTLGLTLDGGYTNDDSYEKVVGKRCLEEKMAAFNALVEAKVARVMLAAIIVRGVNEHAIPELIELAEKHNDVVRYIHFRNVGQHGVCDETEPYSMEELNAMVAEHYTEEQFAPNCLGEIHCPPDNNPGCCHRFRPNRRLQVSVIESSSDRSNNCHKKGYLATDKFVVRSFYESIIKSNETINKLVDIPVVST